MSSMENINNIYNTRNVEIKVRFNKTMLAV